jgi:hypothetical protein
MLISRVDGGGGGQLPMIYNRENDEQYTLDFIRTLKAKV